MRPFKKLPYSQEHKIKRKYNSMSYILEQKEKHRKNPAYHPRWNTESNSWLYGNFYTGTIIPVENMTYNVAIRILRKIETYGYTVPQALVDHIASFTPEEIKKEQESSFSVEL